MSPRLLAVALGLAGGLLLLGAGGVSFLAGDSPGWHGVIADLGYACVLGALCVLGYQLVSHAPVWLRAIVSVAFPLLAASVWQVVDQAIDDRVDGWKAPATVHLLAGLIALAAALVASRRGSGERPAAYEPTHHR